MWVKIVDPVKGNNVKSLGNLVGYVSQIMFTQFAAEVYVICSDLAHILSSWAVLGLMLTHYK